MKKSMKNNEYEKKIEEGDQFQINSMRNINFQNEDWVAPYISKSIK